MDKYEQLSIVGEGSYGLVIKCKHRDTEQIVAVKKFLETEDHDGLRKIALREIRMLKKLKHENLVTMIEVFRYRKRFYMVFEYLEGTILDELDKTTGGLNEEACRERIFQITRAVHFCHTNNVIHRDIKPENVLVSSLGVVKLCDFGFARLVSIAGEPCTGYVATRWYRAPELLVRDANYGAPVDIWAIGCLYAEMMTGNALFPGGTDIEQLYLTMQLLGKPCKKHQQMIAKSTLFRGIIKFASKESNGLYKTFSNWDHFSLDFLASCLKMDPQSRPTADELLKHNLFVHDKFSQRYLPILREKVISEINENPLMRRIKNDVLTSTDRSDRIEDARPKRTLQWDNTSRWSINLTDGNIKQKFSCDTINSCDSVSVSDKVPNLTKSSQKLNGSSEVYHFQSFPKQTSLQMIIKEKISKEVSSTPKLNQSSNVGELDLTLKSEVQKLRKTIESLSKIGKKSENIRPLSAQKEEKIGSPILLNPSSPPEFQSLQPTISNLNKSPSVPSQHSQNILHPSINNICFNKEPSKKSPNVFQSVHNTSIKTTFNQIPLLNPPRRQFLKRLDRNILMDTMVTNMDAPVQSSFNSGPSWLNSIGNYKRKDKPKNDEFSLPNIPGATSSSNKTKKKPQISPEAATTQVITPRIKSTTSQKSTSDQLTQL